MASTNISIVAWWGAIIATLVLVWDIYKWRTSRMRMGLRVAPNMKLIGGGTYDESKTYLSITVVNKSDRPTTITHVALQWYADWLSKMKRKPGKSMLVKEPSDVKPIPYLLNPGEEWLGLAIQTAEIESLATSGHLMLEIFHSLSEKSVRARIVMKKAPKGR